MRKLMIMVLLAALLAAPPAGGEETALPRASQLLLFARQALDMGAGYIYGASGQVSTADFRHGRMQLYPQYEHLIRKWGDAWDGLPVYDCIGLFKAFAREHGVASVPLDVNTTGAWETWVADWGPLQDATLTPGMALFRVEGGRMLVQHIGIYVGDGRVIHARGTRWGVVEEKVPVTFTHWATLRWLDMDLPPDATPAAQDVFLPPGALAMVQTADGGRVMGAQTPHEAGKLREAVAYYPDGAILLVLEAPDEMSRKVMGDDVQGRTATSYVRLRDLRDAQDWD